MECELICLSIGFDWKDTKEGVREKRTVPPELMRPVLPSMAPLETSTEKEERSERERIEKEEGSRGRNLARSLALLLQTTLVQRGRTKSG